MTLAPPATPACRAIHPALRPITSTISARWWLSAVVCSRSIASIAILTAVSNPNVKSVAPRSLSMVLGTPTTLPPSWCSLAAAPRVSSPPIAISASTPRLSRFSSTRSTPDLPSTVFDAAAGLVREVPKMVPPRGRMPRTAATSRTMVSPSSGPRQPSRKPMNSMSSSALPVRTTARMTAFSPGQSPPPVRTPTRMRSPPMPFHHTRRHERTGDRRRHHGRYGTNRHRCRNRGGPRLLGIPAVFPSARLGRAPARGYLAGHAGRLRGRAGGCRLPGHRGGWHHQPAGDGGDLGSGHAGGASPRHRLAGPADRRYLRADAGCRDRAARGRADRVAARPVLHRDEADLAG